MLIDIMSINKQFNKKIYNCTNFCLGPDKCNHFIWQAMSGYNLFVWQVLNAELKDFHERDLSINYVFTRSYVEYNKICIHLERSSAASTVSINMRPLQEFLINSMENIFQNLLEERLK